MKTIIKDNKVEKINDKLPPLLKQHLQQKQKKRDSITPMMGQFIAAKDQYPDAIVFFRMGDFYEMFFDDAQNAGKALNLTVTSRNKDPNYDEPMSGFPQSQLGPYLSKALELGFKVAVCDQLEEADKARGLVERGITQVATPGVLLDEEGLVARNSNYLTAVFAEKEIYGIATLDLSASELNCTLVVGLEALKTELSRLEPKELLSCDEQLIHQLKLRFPKLLCSPLSVSAFEPEPMLPYFEKIKGVTQLNALESIDTFGFLITDPIKKAMSALFFYVLDTQKKIPESLHSLSLYHIQDSLILDEIAIQNLELFQTVLGGKKQGSLLDLMDQTQTSMGARRLKQWMTYPLMDKSKIEHRLELVDWLKNNDIEAYEIADILKKCYDLERLNTKTAMGKSNPKDLVAMRNTLIQIPRLKELLKQAQIIDPLSTPTPQVRCLFDHMLTLLDDLPQVTQLLINGISDQPPVQIKDGEVIRRGFHPELDQYYYVLGNQREILEQLLSSEKQKTGINNLKIDYNQVFGFYIEVSKSNIPSVPKHYIRKQTLTNAERYITEELKEIEDQIISAKDQQQKLEIALFNSIRDTIASFSIQIAKIANQLAELDVLVNFAKIAQKYHYCRPKINDFNMISIKQGRHPVVEKMIGREHFIPNDFELNRDDKRLMLITGPNMAGKSTMMRQVALISLMAQMGSFVPAQEAEMGLVDRIFTRVGAADDLASGKSTFMVEMSECAVILKDATPKSLVILDEIGRGTSTFDGMSIAWAVVEALHDQIQSRTLFATHYHELTELESLRRHIVNYTVAIKQQNEDIIFLHQLIKGAANRSYGIQVAKLAGLPIGVIQRAEQILEVLEEKAAQEEKTIKSYQPTKKEKTKTDHLQLSLFSPPSIEERSSEVEKILKSVDVNQFTPMQALNFLHSLVQKLK